MVKLKSNSDQRKKILNERSKNSMRKLREKIKSNSLLHEEAKRKARELYRAKKEEGKIKLIAEVSDREKGKIRKGWRERSKKAYYAKKREANLLALLEEITPPNSPIPRQIAEAVHNPQPGPSRQFLQGKQQQRRNRENNRKEVDQLKKQLELANKKASKYKKRWARLKKKGPNTPNKKVSDLLKGQEVTPEVKRKLVMAEVFQEQIKTNYKKQKTVAEKNQFVSCISEDIIKKYKFRKVIGSISSRKMLNKNAPTECERMKLFLRTKKLIADFFENDKISRICPGKKDTVTLRKIKKQKRYLTDTIKNCFELFQKDHPNVKISYFRFCKFRPFWVLIPSVKNRETCLCVLYENTTLLVARLKILNIINASNPSTLAKEICCDINNEDCLKRVCLTCDNRELNFNNFDDEVALYQRWISKKVEVTIKGEKKMCQKTIKESIESTKENMVNILKETMPKFLKHIMQIQHQYKFIDDIKKNLSENEVLIHMDFSENYNCKYNREIQSAHFGGSKPQISLHTVMVYLKNQKKSMCTFSENLRHDPFAICAHLKPIITHIRSIVPNLHTVHFLSDGPSTQYKNKNMFFLMGNYLSKSLDPQIIRWHYSEPGHGKGAPDGIGGCLKRTADNLVAQGRDLHNFENLVSELQQNCKGINCYTISESDIDEVESAVIIPPLKTFKGTMSIREIIWKKEFHDVLEARSLSCLPCGSNKCSHYGIGTINIPAQFENYETQELPPCNDELNGIVQSSISDELPSDNSELLPTASKTNNTGEDSIDVTERLKYSDVYSSDSSSDDEMTLAELKKKSNTLHLLKTNLRPFLKSTNL